VYRRFVVTRAERAPPKEPTGIAKEGFHSGAEPRHVGAAGTVRGIKPAPELAGVDGACAPLLASGVH
jgi:hypothetical protein